MRNCFIAKVLAALIGLSMAGCGYTFQNSRKVTELETQGVRSIYIAPFKNDTFKPGVENLVYNELVRSIAAGKRVKLVLDEKEADAILQGHVTTAQYASSSQTTADKVFPINTGSTQTLVATEYNASLSCSFELVSTARYQGKKKGHLWGANFDRSKTFPGSNQLGIYGSTSALINDSEFDRALKDLANSMTGDLSESMLALF